KVRPVVEASVSVPPVVPGTICRVTWKLFAVPASGSSTRMRAELAAEKVRGVLTVVDGEGGDVSMALPLYSLTGALSLYAPDPTVFSSSIGTEAVAVNGDP